MTQPEQSRTGRRAAARRRSAPAPSTVAAVVVLVLAVAATVAAGIPRQAPDTSASGHGQLVDDVLAACPQGSAQARILTGSIPEPALGDSGSLAVRTSAGSTTKVPIRRGALTSLPAKDATALEATGPAAAGHFGDLLDDAHGNLSALPCLLPRSTWWFTGAGATLDHTSRLVIANVDPGPAVVDVRVLGEHGPLDTVGTRGITVAPNSVHTLSLTDIAPQGENLAIEVQASRGRVAAAVSDSFAASPGAAPGTDWLPDQRLPSRVVRVAPTPSRGSRPTLLLANPSSLTALVDVRIQGHNGVFTPTENAQIQIAPDSTRSIDLGSAFRHGAAGVLLRSRVPVLATVRSLASGDSLYAGAVRPLESPGSAAWSSAAHPQLLLTAGALPATAAVAAFDRSGHQVATTELQLSAGSTTSWKPPARADYLTVTPSQGAVHGAVVLNGAGVAELPLRGVPIHVQRPAVHPGTGGSAYSSSP